MTKSCKIEKKILNLLCTIYKKTSRGKTTDNDMDEKRTLDDMITKELEYSEILDKYDTQKRMRIEQRLFIEHDKDLAHPRVVTLEEDMMLNYNYKNLFGVTFDADQLRHEAHILVLKTLKEILFPRLDKRTPYAILDFVDTDRKDCKLAYGFVSEFVKWCYGGPEPTTFIDTFDKIRIFKDKMNQLYKQAIPFWLQVELETSPEHPWPNTYKVTDSVEEKHEVLGKYEFIWFCKGHVLSLQVTKLTDVLLKGTGLFLSCKLGKSIKKLL